MDITDIVKTHWPSVKIGLKAKYPQLTDDDLSYEEGYEKEMFHNLQLKTGKNEEQFLAEVNSMIADQPGM